jgi:capsular polysaccharide biosynthesis protein
MSLLQAARRHPIPVVIATAAGIAAAFAVLAVTPSTYQSSAVVNIAASPAIAAEDLFGSTNFVQQRASTYAALVGSEAFVQEIAEQIPGDVRPVVSAAVQADTSLMTLSASAPTAEEAQQVANLATGALVARAGALDVGPGGIRTIDLVVVEPAGLPESPVQPVPWIFVAIGLIAGLGVGLGVVKLRSRSDSRVSRPGDLVEFTGDAGAVFTLPDHRWNGEGSGPRHTEYAQRLASVHQEFVAMPGRENRILLIVAPTQSHAETAHQVAEDMSLTLVRGGRRVVVLRLEGDEQQEYRPGLSDVLAGSHSIRQVIFRDMSGRLDVGPGQQILRLLTATEREIRGVVDQLLAVADFIIVDVPPLSSPVGFPVMSQVADAVLVTATLNDLRTAELTSAHATVQRLRVRFLGLLLAPREPLPLDIPDRIPQRRIETEGTAAIAMPRASPAEVRPKENSRRSDRS